MFHLTLVRRQSDNIKLPGLDPPAYQTSTVAPAIPSQFLLRICHNEVTLQLYYIVMTSPYPASDDGSLTGLLDISVWSYLVLRQTGKRGSTMQYKVFPMGAYLVRNIGDEKWSFNILRGEVNTLLGGDATEQ